MSWPLVKLKDICETTQGVQVTKENTSSKPYKGGYRYLYIADFLRDTKLSFIDDVFEHKKVTINDLVMANTGSPGRVFKGKEGILSNNLFKISFNQVTVDRDYLFYVLSSDEFQYILQTQMKGGIQKHLGHQTISKQVIPLPPLETQKKIAAVLEKADQLRKDCQQMEQELNSLAQSVFIDMFGDPVTNPKGWEKSPLSSITEDFLGGKSLVASDDNNTEFTNRVLKISAVTSGEFKPNESKPLPNDYQPQDEHFVQVGDLLFSRANTTELVGATSMVFEEYKNLLLPDKLWRFIWNKEKPVSVVFIWQQLCGEAVRKEISKLSSGSGGSMKNISKGKLKTLPVILPPIELQEKFERVYMKLRAELQNNKQQIQSSEHAFSSLMQKAFKGELNL